MCKYHTYSEINVNIPYCFWYVLISCFIFSTVAGFIGHFIGKVMYLPVCQQKILTKLPNSNLAAAIRKSKGLPDPEKQ